MNSKTKVNWAILGAGNIAKKFATDLATVENATCYAVASRSLEKATQFAHDFGFEKSFGSYEAMVKDPNVDAVYIAVPHTYHAATTKLCLNHNKAVLCEKPFAMNTAEVEEMIALAKTKNTLLMEAMWTYFLPHFEYTTNLITNNHFGKVKKLTADFGFVADNDPNARLLNKALGGGSLLDIGIYPVFAALALLGKPENIKANAHFFETGADSECNITFEYANGATAALKSTLLNNTPTKATIECEKGTITLNSKFYEPTTVTLQPNNEVATTTEFNCKTIGYSYEAQHFGELYLQGKTESPIMTFDTSTNLIALLDAIRSAIGLDYSV